MDVQKIVYPNSKFTLLCGVQDDSEQVLDKMQWNPIELVESHIEHLCLDAVSEKELTIKLQNGSYIILKHYTGQLLPDFIRFFIGLFIVKESKK